MGETQPTDKPLFSIKDLLYFAVIIGGFFVNYFLTVNSIKLDLHDAVAEINYNKKESEYKFNSFLQTQADQSKKIDYLFNRLPLLTAIKPKETKIEIE